MSETDLNGAPMPPLREYVLGELDRIIAESGWPLIRDSLTQHLRSVVAAWPDVVYHGPGPT